MSPNYPPGTGLPTQGCAGTGQEETGHEAKQSGTGQKAGGGMRPLLRSLLLVHRHRGGPGAAAEDGVPLPAIRGGVPLHWLLEIREHYACPGCGTLNSAYDLRCRSCGVEPSCGYVARHCQAIEAYLKNHG